MLAKARIGFVVGIIGLVLNGLVSGFKGIAGLFLSLVAGAMAGFIVAWRRNLSSKREGARVGALAGGIAGGTVIFGQVIGAMITLLSRPLAESLAGQLFIAIFGAGLDLVVWIVIALLAASVGAGVGYFVTASQLPVNNPPKLKN